MFAILVSALNVGLAWVFRVVVVKALIFGVLLAVTTEVTSYMIAKLGGGPVAGLNSAFAGMPGGVLWVLNVLRLDVGLPMCIAAAITAFAIRRLPVIG